MNGRTERGTEAMRHLPADLPVIALRHSEAVWVLAEMGFQGGANRATFNEYIKSLRKLGIPFARGKVSPKVRRLANYSYLHLMELALVLTLRVYNAIPDSVLMQIVRHRRTLQTIYRRAYMERESGAGRPTALALGRFRFVMKGAFLDLPLNFSGGKLVSFGPPKLISGVDALKIYAGASVAARAFLPINVSALAEKLVCTALDAPVIRTGPLPKHTRNHRT
jgi:hypothetical protein